jgi:hypothetical protein
VIGWKRKEDCSHSDSEVSDIDFEKREQRLLWDLGHSREAISQIEGAGRHADMLTIESTKPYAVPEHVKLRCKGVGYIHVQTSTLPVPKPW